MKTLLSISTAALLFIAGATTASAQAPQATQSSVTPEVRAVFMRANGGDAAATDKAEEALRRIAEANPADPVARSLHGATLTMQGRDAWMPWTKMKKTEAGLNELDKALAQITPVMEQAPAGQLAPALEVRMNAAGTFLAVPDSIFHRFESARTVIRQALAAPGLASAPKDAKAQLYAWASQVADKAGDKAEAGRLAQLAKDNGWTGALK